MSNPVLPANVSVILSIRSENEGENLTFGPCTTCSYRDACYREMPFCKSNSPENFYREVQGCTNWTDNTDVYEESKMLDAEKKELEKDLKWVKENLNGN